MPDNGSDSTQQTQQTPPGTGAAQTFSGEAAAQNTGFRFTQETGVPTWAVGKTAKEVATMADQIYQEWLRTNGQPRQQQQPQQQYQQQQAPVQSTMPTQDDWLTQPDVAARRLTEHIRTSTIDPIAQQYGASIGQQARAIVEMQEGDAFKRWAPTIDLYISQMDPQFRTVDNIKRVVTMVKAEHLDELAEERVQQRLRTMQEQGGHRADGSAPLGGNAAAPSRVDFNSLPGAYADRLRRHRITEDTLRDFFQHPSMRASFTGDPNASLQKCVDAWLEKAKKGDILTEEALSQ